MSDISTLVLSDTQSPLANMYAKQAAEMNAATSESGGGGYTPGIEPGYYDHYNATIVKGHFVFNKSVKGEKEKYSPFTPDDMYSMADEKGPVNHNFKGFRGIPVGIFLGANLSNYEQTLADNEYGGHCSTNKLEYSLDQDTAVTVWGKQPIQSPYNLGYGLAAYHDKVKDAGKPRRYGNHPFQTYGRASKAYAVEVGRPEVMSCADCISQNLDSFKNHKCKVSGVVAFYVTHLAFETKGMQWRTVGELASELGEGFIAVFKVTGMDLQKRGAADLAKKENHHIPVTAQNIMGYYQTITSLGSEYVITSNIPEVGFLQLLAMPTEGWIADISEISVMKGSLVSYCPDLTFPDSLNARHALLTKAVQSYVNDRKKENVQSEDDAAGEVLAKKEPLKVVSEVSADEGENMFANLVPF